MSVVAHALDNLNLGGIQELVLNLHKFSGHRHVWWVQHGGIFEAEIRAAGMDVFIGDPPADIDVLVGHTVGGWDYNEKFQWAKSKGVYTVECMHSNAKSPTKRDLVDLFVGVSKKSLTLNSFQKQRHIYPPVATHLLTRRLRSEIKNIGRLSRLVPEKDPYTFAMVASLMPELDFCVAGQGKEYDALKKLGLGNMQMVGWERNFSAFYDKLDLYVYSTRDECACASVAMAMAAGVPVICTDIVALRESTGGCAWFVDGGPAQFVDVIRYAQKNYSVFLETAERGRRFVEDNFGLLTTIGAWDEVVASAETHRRLGDHVAKND